MIKPTGPSSDTESDWRLDGPLSACSRVRACFLTHHESCAFSIAMISTFVSRVGCSQPLHEVEMCLHRVDRRFKVLIVDNHKKGWHATDVQAAKTS